MSQGQANPNIAITGSSKVVSIFPGDYAACDEGSYFTSNLAATASTAVSCSTQALGATNPALAIINTATANAAGTAPNIYIRYIRMLFTAVDTGLTTLQAVGSLDPLNPKLSTLGTLTNTAVSTNSNSSVLSKATIYAGVNIASALSAPGRIVHAAVLTNSIPIVLDTYIMAFGEPVSTYNLIGTMSLVKSVVVPVPPVIIAPGWTYTLGLWGASAAASAATIQWDIGWIERPSGQ